MNSPAANLCAFLATVGLLWQRGFCSQQTELRMPGVQPSVGDQYLCTSVQLDPYEAHYLVGFAPHGSMMTAHHMLVYGCSEPGSSEEVWDCGEMHSKGQEFDSGPVCASGSQIIYAWAKDAPELKLPQGVGVKVGGDTQIRHMVLQVHYMHPLKEPDDSGVTLSSTTQKMEKRAAVLLMVTGGSIKPHEKEHFETACTIDEPVEIHPFAFRTHTHDRGKVVSGWKVHNENGQDKWELIGKHDPQLPQMFYPVSDSKMVVKEGDVLAARCSMENKEDREIGIGATGEDEMCNFYIMYYVNGDRILSDNTCYSPGPPFYYWDKQGGLKNVPDKDADTL